MEDNLDCLSGEFVFQYVVDKALPNILQEQRKELDDENFSMKELLRENGLTKINLTTIYPWMRKLGFKYEEWKKCYYVDNHDSESNVKYRRSMLQRYFKYEVRAHRWIQLPLEDAQKLQMTSLLDFAEEETLLQYNRKLLEVIVDRTPNVIPKLLVRV